MSLRPPKVVRAPGPAISTSLRDLALPRWRRLLALAWLLPAPLVAAPDFDAVAALLTARCTICHSGANAPSGLDLGSHAGVMGGSRNGPVVRPGDAAGSEIIRRLKGERLPRMPLTGPPYLSDAEIALVAAWIDGGAVPGRAVTPPAKPARRPGDPVSWAEVEPILLSRCAKCHSANGIMGAPPAGFIVSSYAQTLDAGERARVVPGQPLASELLRRVRGLAQPRMPFDGPPWLGDGEISLIEQWIAGGARDRDGKPAPLPVGARLRFRGTLTGSSEIDGLRFDATGARIDKSPRIGGAAELRGSVAADGSIRATRLRGR